MEQLPKSEKPEKLEKIESFEDLNKLEQFGQWLGDITSLDSSERLNEFRAAALVALLSSVAAENAHAQSESVVTAHESIKNNEFIAEMSDVYRQEIAILKSLGVVFDNTVVYETVTIAESDLYEEEFKMISNIFNDLSREYGMPGVHVTLDEYVSTPLQNLTTDTSFEQLTSNPFSKETEVAVEQEPVTIQPHYYVINEDKIEFHNSLNPETLILSIPLSEIDTTDTQEVRVQLKSMLEPVVEDWNKFDEYVGNIEANYEWEKVVELGPVSELNEIELENWKMLVDNIDEINVTYYPELIGDISLYERTTGNMSDMTKGTQRMTLLSEDIIKNGYPTLIFNTFIDSISFVSSEAEETAVLDNYTDVNDNLVTVSNLAGSRKISISLPLATSEDINLDLDASFLGPRDRSTKRDYVPDAIEPWFNFDEPRLELSVSNTLTIKAQEPVLNSLSLPVFSPITNEDFLSKLEERIRPYVEGAAQAQELFGVKIVNEVIVYDMNQYSNASVKSFAPQQVFTGDTLLANEIPAVVRNVGMHETFHSIDSHFEIAKNNKFVQVYLFAGIEPELREEIIRTGIFNDIDPEQMRSIFNKTGSPLESNTNFSIAFDQWSQFMDQINEKTFFNDVYAEDSLGGHGQSNVYEYFASFVVSLHHPDWEQRVTELNENMQVSYLETLQVLSQILTDLVEHERMTKEAPIITLIDEKIRYVEQQ